METMITMTNYEITKYSFLEIKKINNFESITGTIENYSKNCIYELKEHL